MVLSTPALVLLTANLGLIWLLLAAPIGVRTIRIRRQFRERPERIWSMVHPLGRNRLWFPSILSSEPGAAEGRVVQHFAHADRRGRRVRPLEGQHTDLHRGVDWTACHDTDRVIAHYPAHRSNAPPAY